MRKQTLVAWVLLGTLGLALAGEPGRPEEPGDRDRQRREMEARRRAEMMRRQQMMIPGLPHQIVQFWQQHDPETVDELRQQLAGDPRQHPERVRYIVEETRKLADMQRKDPEAFDLVLQQRRLDRHVRKLATEMRETKEQAEKERIANELRATLDQLFEVREALREREIRGLEARIEEARALAKKRRAHKAEIIEHRIKELRGDLDYLKW